MRGEVWRWRNMGWSSGRPAMAATARASRAQQGRARGEVAMLLATCAGGTPVAQAAADGVLWNLVVFPDVLP